MTQVRLGGTDIALPAAADKAAALPAGLEERIPGISAFRTPNDDFYRVDTALTVPAIDVDSWSLTIDGDVDQEVELSFDDLAGMRLVERDITLTCVSNDVGGPYIGAARWLGVPLQDVLDQAGIDTTGADQILCTDVDGMTISVPLKVALDGRDALIAIGMNGEALPREHGFPVRMVVPGLYGFVSACKWMVKMTLTTYDEQEAYWTERDWAIDAPIKLSSRIDTPSRCPTATRARPSSAASPGPRAPASRASRSASTAVRGSPPSSAPTPVTTTGASGSTSGTPSPASTSSPAEPPTRTGTSRQPSAHGPSRRARAASRRSRSTSADTTRVDAAPRAPPSYSAVPSGTWASGEPRSQH